MHGDGRNGLKRRQGVLLLTSLVLATACKKSEPAPSAPASSPDLSMPSRSASSSPPAHPVDPGMERLLAAHYGNDEAKKKEVRSAMQALDAEAAAAEELAAENRRTMIIPAPPDFKPESVDRKVRLRLALQSAKLHPGDFLRIRLEMTNVGRQAIDYHEIGGGIFKYGNLGATRSVFLYVTDPDGHREKLDAAPASRKVKGAKPVDTGFNFLPADMPAADKEKWLQKTMAESAASQYFQVKLLPGETLKSLGDKDGDYRTVYCEQDFIQPGRYQLEAVLDDRPSPMTNDYIEFSLRTGDTRERIRKRYEDEMKDALGPVASNLAQFEVTR